MESELYLEAARQLEICNACRYCEGYCAVFPALERERAFDIREVEYLASLCHDCQECFYACQYAPPHEFGVNIPKVLTEVREETYKKYVWPQGLGEAVSSRPWWAMRLTLALVVVAFALIWALAGHQALFAAHVGGGAFYKVIPYTVMVTVFMLLGLGWIGVWLVEAIRYWRGIKSPPRERTAGTTLRTLGDILVLRYLGGGGAGCTYPTDQASSRRRVFHQLVMYGFVLDFASTTLAAIYQHVFNLVAPYPVLSPVVVLGTLGGIGIVVGTVGLLVQKAQRNRETTKDSAAAADSAFLTSLLAVAVTGIALLVVRSTPAMGSMLAVHLGTVAAFFIMAPYTKFRHAIYRAIAIWRYHSEGETSTVSALASAESGVSAEAARH